MELQAFWGSFDADCWSIVLCVDIYVSTDNIYQHSCLISGRGKKGNGKGQLEVMVKEARNLTGVKSNGFSDPFCKGWAFKS